MKYVLVGTACLILVLAFVFGSSYYKGQQAEKYWFYGRKKR